jgi:chromosome segregation ATPase
VAQSHERCDNIENASKSVTSLKQDYADLDARLAPFAAAADGVTRRVKDLSEARDRLAASIDSLLRTPEGPLAQRVQDFANESKKLDNGVSDLNAHFTKLAALHGNIGALAAKLESALHIIPAETNGHGASDVDTRVDEVSAFVTATQEQLEDIEDRLAVFGELKAKLGDLQSRLAPLESKDTGVVNLIRQVQELRDQLVAKIGSLQDGDGGDLAARVRTFTEAKQELEGRVSTVSEHFSQLASVRKDLAGLFDKLSSAAKGSNGSSN